MGDRVPRLHVPLLPGAGLETELSASGLRHGHVLRLRAGDAVELFDGQGGLAKAKVQTAERRRMTCLVETSQRLAQPRKQLNLLLCATKGDKSDLVVRMATELGVHSLEFVYSDRSVAKERGREGRLLRLQAIAMEACAQSGNLWCPNIRTGRALLEVAAEATADAARVVYWERASTALMPLDPGCCVCWAVVGPEGGLSQEEVAELRRLGYMTAAFSTPILRAETAAVVAAARLSEQLSRACLG